MESENKAPFNAVALARNQKADGNVTALSRKGTAVVIAWNCTRKICLFFFFLIMVSKTLEIAYMKYK